MQHQVFLGQFSAYKMTAHNKPILLLPGETMEVSLNSEYDEIKRLVEFTKRPIEDVTKITLRLSQVGFEDQTLYSGGSIVRRNPDPNGQPKWLPVIE